ncbi:MAG: citrate synthase [Myxococcota bacterium]
MGNCVASGLEGVIAADTVLSSVDGERGRLILRGHALEALAGVETFEGVCGLFLDGALPEPSERVALGEALARGRVRAFEHVEQSPTLLGSRDGMAALRMALASLECEDPLEITASVGVFAAAWSRLRRGLAPVPPDPDRGHAADTLRMVAGVPAHRAAVEALECYWVTVVDHGMNASTFTARVVASTGSDRVSAVVAAIGALKGPRHGGVPGPVLDMLDAIGTPQRAQSWLAREIAAGRRIMGMGHRVYRVRDPRAAVLEAALGRLEASGTRGERLALARHVEGMALELLRERHPDRRLEANVEFYTAVLLEAVGLPRPALTPMFAAARVVGWLAHFDEQARTGRLIRPLARYVGSLPGPRNRGLPSSSKRCSDSIPTS